MDSSDDNFGTIDITINDNKKNPTKSSIVIEIKGDRLNETQQLLKSYIDTNIENFNRAGRNFPIYQLKNSNL